MPEPPRTGDAVLDLIRKSELVDDDALSTFLKQSSSVPSDTSAADYASQLVKNGILTPFQAKAILLGKCRGFRLGPYRILDQIGSGGMGQVFLAEHAHMKRRVAVKVLPPRLALDKAMVERFYREARAVAALDHPNIVRAHDVACYKGTHYLVLEYIVGRSLAERMLARTKPIPIGVACGYIVQAASGLKHAHDKGVAHRDIKPGNILVDKEGVVKILDMGLARFFDDDRDQITRDLDGGSVMGTADYVAPEQLIDSASADHRADIYSLGATFYHLITGRTPFEGSTTAKLVAHHMKALTPAHTVREDVPEEISEIIERMMAKDPAERYQSATELITDLLPHVGDMSDEDGMPSGQFPPIIAAALGQGTGLYTAMLPPTGPENTPPTQRPNRKKQFAIAGLIASILIGGGLIVAFAVVNQPGTNVVDSNSPTPSDESVPHVVPKHPFVNPKGADVPDTLTRAFKLDVGKTNVEAALFTPDDKFLITSGSDKLVRVWDGMTGRAIRKLEGHTQNVRDLAMLPDGGRVLSASHDKQAKLWDISSGNCLHTYVADAPLVGVVAHPDGRRFLTSGTDGSIWLWDIETGEVLKKYDRASLPVYGLNVSRDGRRVIAGTWDPKRNMAKAEEIANMPPVSVWAFEIESGKELKRIVANASVSRIGMSPDGRLAVFGTNTGVTVWDIDSGSFRTFTGVMKRTVAAAFTQDGQHIVSTGHDNAVTFWELASGRAIASEAAMLGAGYNISQSNDGKRAAVVGANGAADVWKLPTALVPMPSDPALPQPIAMLTSPSGTPEDLIFTANGNEVIGAAQGCKHLMVWNATNGAEISRLKLPDNVNGCRALALLPGNRVVGCGPGDPAVHIWDLKSGEIVKNLTADKVNGYVSVATTKDGRVLATGNDKTVRMWNVGSQKELARFDIKTEVRGIAVTPDGKQFVVGCLDKTVRLWDVASKTEVRSIPCQTIAWRLGLSPDAKWTSFGNNNGITLWNLETAEVRYLQGSEKFIDGTAYTRDGRYVLGGSADKGLYVFEVATNRWVGRVTEHANNIRSVVISPDGKRIATSSTDNTGMIWQLPEALWK